MRRFLFHLIHHNWRRNLRCHFILLIMITLVHGNDRLKTQQYSLHCGQGFRMTYSPITWVNYVGSRGECLLRCVAQKKCLAVNFITTGKAKMICEMFDYIIRRCEADSKVDSYKLKVAIKKLYRFVNNTMH